MQGITICLILSHDEVLMVLKLDPTFNVVIAPLFKFHQASSFPWLAAQSLLNLLSLTADTSCMASLRSREKGDIIIKN